MTEEGYMCWGMDEQEVQDLADRAILAWGTTNKNVGLLMEFAKLAKDSKDNHLVHFRERLWERKNDVPEHLWEIVEKEFHLAPLDDDMRVMGELALSHVEKECDEPKERWG